MAQNATEANRENASVTASSRNTLTLTIDNKRLSMVMDSGAQIRPYWATTRA
jgi:hypothetical protein